MATFLERALAWTNGALVIVTDALFAPLASLPPVLSLLLLALITAAGMVAVIARTSNQPRMRQTKRRLQAALFEIRLFNDDPGTVFRAVRDALRANVVYLRLSLIPLAILSAPFMLVMSHLDPFYGYSGLTAGTPALLKVERATGAATRDDQISLITPDAITVDTGPVRLVANDEVLWQIIPTAQGDFSVTVHIGATEVSKTLRVGDGVARRSPARVHSGLLRQLLNPSEPALPKDGPTSAVIVTYPAATIDVFGQRMHWSIVYVVFTVVAALGFARARKISL